MICRGIDHPHQEHRLKFWEDIAKKFDGRQADGCCFRREEEGVGKRGGGRGL